MTPTALLWFGGLAIAAWGMLGLGSFLGERSRAGALAATLLAFGLLIIWAFCKYSPALPATIIPLDVLVWVEGVLATLPWMLLVGVLTRSSATERIHRSRSALVTLGFVYYLYGGIWMLLPTIRPDHYETVSNRGVTIQSRHDTCAPSAAATALRYMGFSATEYDLCRVVLAKPGKGSSLVRTTWGLSRLLEPYGYRASLEDLTAEEVARVATRDRPVLITIRASAVADHMVAVLGMIGTDLVLIANPEPVVPDGNEKFEHSLGYGWQAYSLSSFRALYRGGAIVFHDLTRPLTPDRLAQHAADRADLPRLFRITPLGTPEVDAPSTVDRPRSAGPKDRRRQNFIDPAMNNPAIRPSTS